MQNESVQHQDPARGPDLGQGADLAMASLHGLACVTDRAGRLLQVGQDLRRLTVADEAEMPTSLLDLVAVQGRPGLRDALDALASDAAPQALELPLRTPAGLRWCAFEVSAQPALDGGAPTLLWQGTDIHRYKQRIAELEQLTTAQSRMLDVSQDCIKIISLDGRLLHMNRAGCQALGVAADSGFGMPWLPLLPQDVHRPGARALERVREGHADRFTGRSEVEGGAPEYWDNLLTPMLDEAQQPTAILCISRNVTGERLALEAARDSEARLVVAARVGGLGIWDYNVSEDHFECDETWCRIMGLPPGQAVSTLEEFRRLIHPDDRERATQVETLAAEMLTGAKQYSTAYRIVRPDGEVRWIRSAARMETRGGAAPRAVGFAVDVTDAMRGEHALRDANRRLRHERDVLSREAQEDALTGVANRRGMDRQLDDLLAGAGGAPVCVGMIDLDDFKAFNDLHGHLEGDRALRQVAQALGDAVRPTDLVARYGGEEFVFVLAGTENPEPFLRRVFERVHALGIAHAGTQAGILTISCGCVVCHDAAPDQVETILAASDAALYEAKRLGRDQYVIVRQAPAPGG